MIVDLNRVSSYLMRERELNESRKREREREREKERERQKIVLARGDLNQRKKSWARRNRLTKAKGLGTVPYNYLT